MNSIWEGSGNVIALDVLRAMQKEPLAVDALLEYIESSRGADATLDRRIVELKNLIAHGELTEEKARQFVERIALVLQTAALFERAPSELAEAFCRARIGTAGHLTYGAGWPLENPKLLLERAMPA